MLEKKKNSVRKLKRLMSWKSI